MVVLGILECNNLIPMSIPPYSPSPQASNQLNTDYPSTIIIQVNEKFKKGHIGIVEKAQETSSDSDMHNTVCLCHCSTS